MVFIFTHLEKKNEEKLWNIFGDIKCEKWENKY